MKPGWIRIAFGTAAVVASAGALALLFNAVAGRFLSAPWPEHGLLFAPGSTIHYDTREFQAVAHINTLGFRGPETSSDPPIGRARILAIGDSFTFGFGVNDEEPWPHQLEILCAESGHDVEVLNLGVPGASLYNYLEIAERAIPYLQPDLVILGLLQLDDLAPDPMMSLEGALPESALERIASAAGLTLRSVAPNLYYRLGRFEARPAETWNPEQTHTAFRTQYEQYVANASQSDTARIAALPEEVRRDFERGLLNPVLLSSAGGISSVLQLLLQYKHDNPVVDQALALAGERLEAIKRTAARNGAAVLAVSLPIAASVSPACLDFDARYLLEPPADDATREALGQGTKLDDVSMEVIERAGVPGCRVQPSLRAAVAASKAPLFFLIDGHPTAAGHRAIAAAIFECLKDGFLAESAPKSLS